MKALSYHRRKFFIVPIGLAAVALFSFVTMMLWNALLPELFHFSTITFWQAAGLLILARLFFGSFRSKYYGWHSPYMNNDLRSKIKNMTPEEKKEFFRKMHYNHEVWHREKFNEKKDKPNESDND